MGEFKKKIKARYEDINANLLSFIRDIKNIKDIGISLVWKRNKYKIIITLISIIVASIFLITRFSLSKEEVLNKFQSALINGNSSMLSHYVKVENERVSSKQLQPLIDNYDQDATRIKKIVDEIGKNRKSGKFTLESKKGFLKEKYYINIDNVTVKFTSDVKDVNIEFSNKRFKLIDEAEFEVVPGSYRVQYTYKTEYGDITDSKTINLMENDNIEIKVDGIYLTLYSNFDDAQVFINGINSGLLVKDIKNYGPIPKNKDIKIYIQKEFPWGIINSEEVPINNNQYIKLDINMVNDNLNNIIDEIVKSFYSSVFEALNKRDKNIISNSTDEVKTMIYNYINEKTFLLRNNYEITDLAVEIERSDFKYEESKYKASLVTKVNYSIYKKLLPFVKNSNESSFILSLEYEDGTFIINGIQKVDI